MATRQNKKRKGRNNAPPRERTVTTLTDGPAGPFLPSSPLPDDPSPSQLIISPPFSVNPGSLPPPMSTGPFPFSNPFSYSYTMSSLPSAPPFQSQQLSSSQPFLSPSTPAPQSIAHLPQSLQQQNALPAGQSDLEILTKLKETIKNNQHELFRPVPQPAALASVYLGPRSSLAPESHVPPHPEQVPTDVLPPGLTMLASDATQPSGDTPSATLVNQTTSPRVPDTPDPKDVARTRAHRPSVSEPPKTNTVQPLTPQSPSKRTDVYGRPPRPPSSITAPSPSKSDKIETGGSQRLGNISASPRVGPPGLQRLEQNGRAGEITKSPVPLSARLPLGPKDDLRPKESSSAPRSGIDDRETPVSSGNRVDLRTTNSNPPGIGNESRGLPPRDQRPLDREKERDRERDRDRSREREYDRDLDRDRRPGYDRFRDDRRNDDRPRPPDDRRPPNGGERRYESRYPPRRYDSKASEGSFPAGRDDRNAPDTRPPPRNLGEERAIIRPPLHASPVPASSEDRRGPVASADDRSVRPPPSTTDDDRRLPVPPSPTAERPTRPNDDRRPVPPAVERPGRFDDRRPLPPPSTDRPGVGADDRRRPPSPGVDRASRILDNHRPHVIPPAFPSDRPSRPGDDRRPPVSATTGPEDRPLLSSTAEDRRPPPSAPADRLTRPAEDRRPPVLEERAARVPVTGSTDSVPTRSPIDGRTARSVAPDDRGPRASVPLEERISRVPSLQERLSHPAPPRPVDDRPVPRLEERLSRPGNALPSLEERLSNPPTADSRPLRPPVDDRPPRPTPPSERPVVRSGDDRPVVAEPARALPVAERTAPPPDDRYFNPAGRFARPASPAVSDRGHSSRPYRAASVTRDDARPFRPPSPSRPLSRADVRDLRPVAEHRDRVDARPAYRSEPERYPPERERRPDLMDVDPPSRFADSRPASYRRPSPPATDSYPPRSDRSWVPAGEAPSFRENEPSRRAPPMDAHGYAREWREGDRPYGDDWNERSWDRAREYDRDGRFPERDAVPGAWETREERERRATYPPPSDLPPSASRSFEQRPLSSRLTDPYPDDRGYGRDVERGRYPPVDPPSYSRVRPRSPSPLRRSTGMDDLRPPLKRARDDTYPGGGYHPPGPSDEPRGPADYPPRLRSPPPANGGFYDDPRYNPGPGGARDRDYPNSRDRDVGHEVYERRGDPSARRPLSRSPSPPPNTRMRWYRYPGNEPRIPRGAARLALL